MGMYRTCENDDRNFGRDCCHFWMRAARDCVDVIGFSKSKPTRSNDPNGPTGSRHRDDQTCATLGRSTAEPNLCCPSYRPFRSSSDRWSLG